MLDILTQLNSNALILWILILCSLIAMAVFIERLWILRQSEINTDQFIIQLRQSIQDGNIVEAIQQCDDAGGSLASIIKAGLLRHNSTTERIERSMEAAGRLEISQLERNARVLSIISYVAPLIGLLGTVLGFMQAFSEMRLSGMVDITASRIGSALEYALLTTAVGLIVAIPAMIAYNYLVSKIEAFVLEIETTSSEIVDILLARQEDY
ncbi:MAG: MotA/TolQ/ExbB proton channel family protein [Parachlamydiales bacterium]|jgi:biopolymer transport protein ExbB